jgi:hypothetical protein
MSAKEQTCAKHQPKGLLPRRGLSRHTDDIQPDSPPTLMLILLLLAA